MWEVRLWGGGFFFDNVGVCYGIPTEGGSRV